MKDFPWRAGMKRLCPSFRFDRVLEVVVTSDGVTWLCMATDVKGMIERDDPPEGSPWGWVKGSETDPDPNDGATKGALLDVVRELWGFPDLYPRCVSEGRIPNAWHVSPPMADEPPFKAGWGFVVGCAKGAELARRVGIQPTEFAALLAAYQESP